MNKLSFLPGCRIAEIRRAGSGTLIVVAHSRRSGARCPDCGQTSRAVHSRYHRSPADLPVLGCEIRISLRVRRFYCRVAVCPRRTFAERFAPLLASFARRTRRLDKALARIRIALGGAAGARLSRELAMPTSGDILLRTLRWLPVAEAQAPRVVAVDDFGRSARGGAMGRSWLISSAGASSTCSLSVRPRRSPRGCANTRALRWSRGTAQASTLAPPQ